MNPETRRAIERSTRIVGRAGQELYRHVLRPAVLTTGRVSLWGLREIDHRFIDPAVTRVNRELDHPMPRMSRRRFGKIVATLAAGGALVGAGVVKLSEDSSTGNKRKAESGKIIETKSTFYEPFNDKDANEVAKEIGFTAGSLFVVPEAMIPKLTAFLGDELLPIYPPAVMTHYKNLIYKLSAESGVPPNVLAMIMTIESAGYREAVSGAEAQGLYQVMPFHFEAQGVTSGKNMREPALNGRYGAQVYKDFLNVAKREYPFWKENDPRLVARALMGYNGGYDGIRGSVIPKDGELLAAGESAYYGDFIIRFIVMAEIADRLRRRGFSDTAIIRKIQSEEISRRAYALQEYKKRQTDRYEPYSRVCKHLAAPTPWDTPEVVLTAGTIADLRGDYERYDSTPSAHLPYPLSPALELWYRIGGKSLYEDEGPEPKNYEEKVYNQNPRSWDNVYTRRELR